MNKLFLDIETIPCQRDGALDEIRATIAPPGTIKKAESIADWMVLNADTAAEEQYRKTSFDGAKGEICCIGWAVNDEPVQTTYRDLHQSESVLLMDFFAAQGVDKSWQIIGHNVISFDIRFLYNRCVINSVRPSFNLRQDERYNGGKVYDTMLAWAGWGNRISLKNLSAALGVKVKSAGLDGSKVWDYVQAGRIKEVADYCAEDVEATREIYRRMTFNADFGADNE